MPRKKSTARPGPGVRFARLYAPRQSLYVLSAEQDALGEEGEVTIGWDWRFAEAGVVEVLLRLEVGPSITEPQVAAVWMVGAFIIQEPVDREGLLEFVRFAAPPIIFPYARQAYSAMCHYSPAGPRTLDLVLLHPIMEGMDEEAATGYKQLSEDPDLISPSARAMGGPVAPRTAG